VDEISDGRIDIADNDESPGHRGVPRKDLYRRKIQHHDEEPVGDGFHHRSFPMFRMFLFIPFDFSHFVFLSISDLPREDPKLLYWLKAAAKGWI
jgi:hypothetical protein